MAANDGPSQVYISFGEDTRNNFTSFLVRALEIEGFDVFIHDENLSKGEAILPSLFRIIRSSKISILVISDGYVDSQWCLQEMVEIVKRYQSKCQILLPVLFYVGTADFYYQTGFVAELLKNHEKRIDDQTLQKWKDALTVVAGMRGYDLYSPLFFGKQAKQVNLIVQWALTESGSFRSLDRRGKVFINYRKEDTGNTFTGFLRCALEREGIDTFIDSENLPRREELLPSLFRIIQSSKISIPVISKGYADSRWRLIELAEMVECYEFKRQIILPVFFDVDPNETGIFDVSFEKHKEDKIDDQTLKRWKNALTVVAHLGGYKLKDVKGDQAELVDLIVEEALIKSSSFHSNDGCAEVFTNYQRKDTVNNFCGFLRNALGKRRIDAFINSEDLATGENFSNHSEKIQSSKISISIISKGYVDSRWCLTELAGMVERYKANCQIIMPVFLDVDPKDANFQTGISEASFEKHKNDEIDEQTLKIWKYALTVVAGIPGFHLKDVNGNQTELVNLVVQQAFIESSNFRPECRRGRLYLSCKGFDIYNFTNFLRIALEREGFDVCGKNEFMVKREAISSSEILIAVIYKGYADSQLSLMELAEMVECYESKGQIILPIFFDVELEDVRNQLEIFKESFEKHEDHHIEEQTLQTWKNALTVLAEIQGFQLKDVNGNQAKLVDLIVERALINSREIDRITLLSSHNDDESSDIDDESSDKFQIEVPKPIRQSGL